MIRRSVEGRCATNGNTVRRVDGEVLDIVWVGEKVARRYRGEVLNETWTNGTAARRVGGGILSKVGAGGKAAKRFGNGVLNRAGAEGKAARRSGGGFLRSNRIHKQRSNLVPNPSYLYAVLGDRNRRSRWWCKGARWWCQKNWKQGARAPPSQCSGWKARSD